MDSQHSDMQDKETDNPRQRLRSDLIVAMRSHHQHRRNRRRSLATAILVISAGTLAYFTFGRDDATPAPPVVRDIVNGSLPDALRESSLGNSEPRHSIITIVRTDPSILERYASHTTSRIESISDETLLASLASLGRPTGLIRYDGRVRLTTDVTDVLEIDNTP